MSGKQKKGHQKNLGYVYKKWWGFKKFLEVKIFGG